MMCQQLVTALVVVLALVRHVVTLTTTVTTTSGTFEGNEMFETVRFLGIPYAEAPVGERRFQKPVWKTRMPGTYNATYYRPKCPQTKDGRNVDGVEDCLYLNIFAPKSASRIHPKPVMVWVHGGGFVAGSGQEHDGTILVLQGDIVYVNLNYRLGALGFLNTDDDYAGGNFGLWDQTMALTWIYANIGAFGGDPDQITIFGESAGGDCVTELALSPFTDGLFKKVIAESGSVHNPVFADFNTVKSAQQLGRRLGCPTETNKALIACMKRVSYNDIVKRQGYLSPNPFAPTFHSEFLPYHLKELYTTAVNSSVAKRFAELDFIIGFNVQEGGFMYAGFLENQGIKNYNDGISQEEFDNSITSSIHSQMGYDSRLTAKMILPMKFMYTDWDGGNDDLSRAKMLIQILGDNLLMADLIQFARTHLLVKEKMGMSDANNTFVYLFMHRLSSFPSDPWRIGADHADEIPFVFGHPHTGFYPNISQAEKDLSTQVMAYWTNFAKSGNPNIPDVESLPTTWPPFELGSEQTLKLDIGISADSVTEYVFNDRVHFWLDFYIPQLEMFRNEPPPRQCPKQ